MVHINQNTKSNSVKQSAPAQKALTSQKAQSSSSIWSNYNVNNGGQYSIKMSALTKDLKDNVVMKIIDSNKDGRVGQGDIAMYTDKKGVEQNRPILGTKFFADSSSQDVSNNPVAISLGSFDEKGAIDNSKNPEKFITSFANIRQGEAVLNFEEKNVTTTSVMGQQKECLTGEAKLKEHETNIGNKQEIATIAKEVKKNNSAIDNMARNTGEDSKPILNNLFTERTVANDTNNVNTFNLKNQEVKDTTIIVKAKDGMNTEISGLRLQAARTKIEKPALEQLVKPLDPGNLKVLDLQGFSRSDFQ